MNIKSYYATVWMIEVNEGVASLLFNSDISTMKQFQLQRNMLPG